MTSALVLALALASAPTIRPLAPGDTLPSLRGHDLAKGHVALPAQAGGRVALLALGFTYTSRHPVEAWSKRFREAYAGDSTVTWYEVPVMSGAARMARVFIDRGMRRGTPKEFHRNVVTVWSDADDWRRRLSVKDPDAAYLVLLAPDGRIAWMHSGGPDEESWHALGRAVAELRRR